MSEENNGVSTEVDKKIEEDLNNDGQNSQEHQGTGNDADATLENKDSENNEDNKDGEDGKVDADPKELRINNLMSNWQSEASSHNKTKTELGNYKQKFGNIDAEPKITDTKDDDLPESFKPEWKPETTADIQKGMREAAEYGARKALGTIEESNQAKRTAEQAVDGFIAEVKEADPEFVEKEFYGYANKHHFPLKNVQDLRSVYSSYYENQLAIAKAGQTAIKNKEKRTDTVNKPGAGGEGAGNSVDYAKIHGASSSEDLIHDHYHQ